MKNTRTARAPRQRLTLSKRHPVRPISTRRYYPGLHRVEQARVAGTVQRRIGGGMKFVIYKNDKLQE